MSIARVQWPEKITAGDVVKVRIFIQHAMDTGLVSANPFFEFFVRATSTAEFKVEWTDDKGVKSQHRQLFKV